MQPEEWVDDFRALCDAARDVVWKRIDSGKWPTPEHAEGAVKSYQEIKKAIAALEVFFQPPLLSFPPAGEPVPEAEEAGVTS